MSVAIATWGPGALQLWEDAVDQARAKHAEWVQKSPEQRALTQGITRSKFQLPSTVSHVEANLRAELLEHGRLPPGIHTVIYHKGASTILDYLQLIFQR